jgi:hypothetical protein
MKIPGLRHARAFQFPETVGKFWLARALKILEPPH